MDKESYRNFEIFSNLESISNWLISVVSIKTFSYPSTDLPYPAITICSENQKHPRHYLRTVFDSFQLSCRGPRDSESCNRTRLLRENFFRNRAKGTWVI